LLVLYESLIDTWTSYPFVLHALATDDPAAERLSGLGLERLEVHRPGDRPGLERRVESDTGNVFLAEVPEVWFLLDTHDLVEPTRHDFLRGVRAGAGGTECTLPPAYP